MKKKRCATVEWHNDCQMEGTMPIENAQEIAIVAHLSMCISIIRDDEKCH